MNSDDQKDIMNYYNKLLEVSKYCGITDLEYVNHGHTGEYRGELYGDAFHIYYTPSTSIFDLHITQNPELVIHKNVYTFDSIDNLIYFFFTVVDNIREKYRIKTSCDATVRIGKNSFENYKKLAGSVDQCGITNLDFHNHGCTGTYYGEINGNSFRLDSYGPPNYVHADFFLTIYKECECGTSKHMSKFNSMDEVIEFFINLNPGINTKRASQNNYNPTDSS